MSRFSAILIAGMLGGAAALPGQEPAGRFVVIPTFGLMAFDQASALSSVDGALSQVWPSAGLSTFYRVSSNLRVGLYLEMGRAETSPDYFPYALLRQTGTYQLYSVRQKVTFFDYGAAATLDLPLGGIRPYLKAGVGGYTVNLDVQRSNSTKAVGGAEFLVGAGLSFGAGSSFAVDLEVADYMWNDWDRNELNVVAPSERNTVFPDDNPSGYEPDYKPGLIHNLRLALGFRFTP